MTIKTIATLLKLSVILTVVGFFGLQCFSSGYSHYETQQESGLNIPENASDINVYSAITTWYCYDFKTDFESYEKWVKSFSSQKLSSIEKTTIPIMAYSKKQDQLLFRENVEHYRASWNFEDQGIALIYVEEEGRAYFSSHSR